MRTNQTKPRRVLVVVANPLGGVRTYLLYNCRRLAESNYAFTFLAPAGEAFDAFKNDVKSLPGVECIGVPVRGRRYFLWPTIRRCLRTRRFSLVHSQGLRSGTETAFANLGLGLSHVITLHDVIVPRNDVPGRLKWLKKRVIGRLASRADAIVPVSQDCAENHLSHFSELKRGRCRIQVILNGVDVQQITRVGDAVDRKALRKKLRFADDVTILGFFGRFMPQKGFLLLLQALRELIRSGHGDRVRLVAAKDPHGYRGEYIREVAQDPLLSTIVRFIAPVTEIATVLPQIDILVTPSLWEACPLLPMEAMILGIPVVGSDAIGLREVLRDTPSLAPPAGDSQALASAILEATDASHRQLAERYVNTARTEFDVTRSVQSLLLLFDELLRPK